MDCVFLRNLRFELSVGPDAWHRHGKTQPVFVSIRLDQSDTAANVDYDTSIIKAAASDDVSKCLDYGKLYKTISAVLTSGDGQFASIRHVAQAVLQCVPHLGTGTARGYKIEVSLPKSSLRAHGGLQYVEEADVVNTSMVYRQTLWISSIQCACILGVNPHERLERQPVIVNLRFQSEDNNCGRASAEATTSSVLAATDQFQEITNAVVKRVEGSAFQTIEALATAVARTATMDFGVTEINVCIDKPSAIANIEAAGVEIRRSASFFKEKDFWDMRKSQ